MPRIFANTLAIPENPHLLASFMYLSFIVRHAHCSSTVVSNLVAIRHMWRQAVVQK